MLIAVFKKITYLVDDRELAFANFFVDVEIVHLFQISNLNYNLNKFIINFNILNLAFQIGGVLGFWGFGVFV